MPGPVIPNIGRLLCGLTGAWWAAMCGGVVGVVNNLFRAWGHQHSHDEAGLRGELARAGFHDIRRHELAQSDDTELAGLEHEERMPPGFPRLETIVLEAAPAPALTPP